MKSIDVAYIVTWVLLSRLAFDGDEPPDLLKECYIRDIHCISSLLKMYFR